MSSKKLVVTSSLKTNASTTDGGEMSVSFANLGGIDATVNGIALAPGQSIRFGGNGCSVPAIAYVATGTSLRIDVERYA